MNTSRDAFLKKKNPHLNMYDLSVLHPSLYLSLGCTGNRLSGSLKSLQGTPKVNSAYVT